MSRFKSWLILLLLSLLIWSYVVQYVRESWWRHTWRPAVEDRRPAAGLEPEADWLKPGELDKWLNATK